MKNGSTWKALAVKLEPWPFYAMAPVVASHFLGGVADRDVYLAVVPSKARHARANVAVGHIDARAVVLAWVGFALVVVCLAVVAWRHFLINLKKAKLISTKLRPVANIAIVN